MNGDPYEEADDQQRLDEAKLVTPGPAKKDHKIFTVGLVLAGVILGLVVLANIVNLNRTPEGKPIPKPTTMSKAASDSFARQQKGQADYFKGQDRDRKQQNNEDTVLGNGRGLAGDDYDEADGVPKKTKAQDDAEHGRSTTGAGAAKSEAEQRRDTAAKDAANRRKNDLDSSAVSIDFSDYFDRERAATKPAAEDVATAKRRHAPLTDEAEGETAEEPDSAASSKKAHDPEQDYEFDSAGGKLYRLMEGTVIETVLVNRLTGASIGQVITMVTTDVYSMYGHLLIPKGSRLLGTVSAVSGRDQERLFVAFHRVIMPDGYSVKLDKFQGLDPVGQTGLKDLVNRHYFRIFGASLALAAIAATAQIGSTASYGTYNWEAQMRSGMSESMAQSAQRVLERFMNTLPTFTIRERSRVKVMLSGDLLLPDTKNHTMDGDL